MFILIGSENFFLLIHLSTQISFWNVLLH